MNSDETLAALAGSTKSMDQIADQAISLWDSSYGHVNDQILKGVDGEPFRELTFVTGGWSENEAVINALRENLFWPFTWEFSQRGGLHTFVIKSPEREAQGMRLVQPPT